MHPAKANQPRLSTPDGNVTDVIVVPFSNALSAMPTTYAPPSVAGIVTAPPFPVSSTEIREKWERGEDISSLVPSSILAYLLKLRKEPL